MIDFNQPVYSRPDGTYVVIYNGNPYHVLQSDPFYAEVQAYLAENTDAVQPEPIPVFPQPSQKQIILAQLVALDAASIRALRAINASTSTPDDAAKLASFESQAQALRAQLEALP